MPRWRNDGGVGDGLGDARCDGRTDRRSDHRAWCHATAVVTPGYKAAVQGVIVEKQGTRFASLKDFSLVAIVVIGSLEWSGLTGSCVTTTDAHFVAFDLRADFKFMFDDSRANFDQLIKCFRVVNWVFERDALSDRHFHAFITASK